MRCADQALYAAKQGGRDRAVASKTGGPARSVEGGRGGLRPMNITAVRIFPFETREAGGRTVAYAEIEIDGGAARARPARDGDGQPRALRRLPAQRARREKLVELVVPLTREARRAVHEAVIGEYKRVPGWQPAARPPSRRGTGAGA